MSAEDQQAMLAEIRHAFAGVTRDGGVSCRVIDDYGDEAERAAARALDRDKSWQEVADDPAWRVDMGVGGLNFLDPVGYRYYLPAAMTVAVRGGSDEWLSSSLILSGPFKTKQWALLNDRQRLCIRHFIEFIIQEEDRAQAAEEEDFDIDAAEAEGRLESIFWRKAFQSFWKDIPDIP